MNGAKVRGSLMEQMAKKISCENTQKSTKDHKPKVKKRVHKNTEKRNIYEK